MIADELLETLDPEQLLQALRAARAEVALKEQQLARREHEVAFKQAVIDKLTHENAVLKRLKFAAKSEAYSAEQKSLLEEGSSRHDLTTDDESPSDSSPDIIGSSGYIPREETADAASQHDQTGSPGAEADRKAAEHGAQR